MRRLSTIFCLLFTFLASQSAWAQCSNLFFSEYIEGTSNNKALEIYNSSSNTIDLSHYQIRRFNNGGLTPATFRLNGLLAPDSVYVIGNPSAVTAILSQSDTTGDATFFNGDDALALIDTVNNDTVDIIGIIGVDPGTNWVVGTGATSEFTLVRSASVNEGTTNWTVGATQWVVLPQNTYDSLGTHNMTPCTPPPTTGPCVNVFFSEYLEGSSNNKALEIYNSSSSTIDLSGYQVRRFNNGGLTPAPFRLNGLLAPDSVYVIGNPTGIAAILSQSDTTGDATFFNGDDALALIDTVNNDTLDIIGIIGVDPGTNWVVGTGATSEFTLVRKATVNEGTKDWAIGATQWEVKPQNFVDSLGSHYMIPCGTVVVGPSTVNFSATSLDVAEAGGSASISLVISPVTADCSVLVSIAPNGTATQGVDYTYSTPDTVVFLASGSAIMNLSIPVTNDTDFEGNESFTLRVDSLLGCSIGASDSILVNILDDDAPIPVYSIGLITADANADGVGDSLGVKCEVRGVVYGVDLRGGNGVQFTLRDQTDGIGVFAASATIGYTTVREGDSLRIIGLVEQFNGLTQMGTLDTIIVADSARAISAPVVVDSLGEFTENELVKIECVKLVNPAQWTGTGSGFTPEITNGTTTFALRIDNDVNLYSLPAPTGYFSVVGLGGQFDSSVPRTSGYQILPRTAADIVPVPAPEVGFATATLSVLESAPSVTVKIDFTGLNPDSTEVRISLALATSTATNGQDFTFAGDSLFQSGSCGTAVSDSLVITLIDDDVIEGDETIRLFLEVLVNGVTTTDLLEITLVDELTDAIDRLLPAQAISMYPNPGDRQVELVSATRMERVRMLDLSGKVLLDRSVNEVRTSLATDLIANGIYLIEVTTAEGRWAQKWVKNQQ